MSMLYKKQIWSNGKQDIEIIKCVDELAKKYNCKMAQISLAWLWTKDVSSPISLLLKWNILMLHRCFQY